jgi:hypothetical protein
MAEALCECGCGEPAPIARRTLVSRGYVKGQPVRFIKGHRTRVGQLTVPERMSKYTVERPTGCWEWIGGHNLQGYGQLKIKGIMQRAHRVAWMLRYGPIPDGLFVLHRCDNPPCCNPDHLFLGTQADNIADRRTKGRAPDLRGSRNAAAKLSEADVLVIRQRLADGVRQMDIAAEFGITQSNVSLIARGITWPDPY